MPKYHRAAAVQVNTTNKLNMVQHHKNCRMRLEASSCTQDQVVCCSTPVNTSVDRAGQWSCGHSIMQQTISDRQRQKVLAVSGHGKRTTVSFCDYLTRSSALRFMRTYMCAVNNPAFEQIQNLLAEEHQERRIHLVVNLSFTLWDCVFRNS